MLADRQQAVTCLQALLLLFCVWWFGGTPARGCFVVQFHLVWGYISDYLLCSVTLCIQARDLTLVCVYVSMPCVCLLARSRGFQLTR
jgi:hypothetical protein